MEVGSRYPLAISMSMLHVSWSNLLRRAGCNVSHREEDNDPGAGVVVLAVGVEKADGVEERRVEGPHVREVCRLKSLILTLKLFHKNSSKCHLEMCDERHQMESYVRGFV